MKLSFGKKSKKPQNDAETDVDVDDDVDIEEEDDVAEEKPKAKKKAKSDGPGAQQFFIDHGEKIALGLVAILAGWIIYSSIGQLEVKKGYSPDKLSSKANSVKGRMASNPSPPLPDSEVIPEGGRTPLDASKYSMKPWDIVLVPRTKRGDPQYLPVTQVVADADIPLYYVTKRMHVGRAGRVPQLPQEELDRREERLAKKKAQREEKAKARDAKEKNKLRAWKRRELNKIRKKKLEGDEKKEEEAKINRQYNRKLADLEGDNASLSESMTVDLPAGFRLGGVSPPAQPEDGKRRRKKDVKEVLVEARPFVVVKGLLPLQAQQAIYDEVFAKAFHFSPQRDRPQYVEARLWRLEVPKNADLENLDWSKAKRIDYKRIGVMNNKLPKAEAIGNWAVRAKEVIDPRYVHDETSRYKSGLGALTKPLGPRVYSSWKVNGMATHPAVPLASRRKPKPRPAPEAAVEATPAKPDREEIEEPVDSLEDDLEDDLVSDEDTTEDETEEEPEQQDDEDETAVVEEAVAAEVSERLVRVFDYTVKPGKYYVYRIGVALRNPNSRKFKEIKDQNVEHPENRDATFLPKSWDDTVWSEPTQPVYVPTGESLMAERIINAIPGVQEQEVDVIARAIDLGTNDLLQMRLQLRRGGMLAGRGAGITIDPVAKTTHRNPEADLVTSMTLIDMRGDQEFKTGSTPTECLYVDERGNISVRRSDQDRRDVEQFVRLEKLFKENAGQLAAEEGEGGDDEGELGFGEDDDDDFPFPDE